MNSALLAFPLAGPRVTVHVVRHGLVHNPSGILYGRLPGYRLSEVGRAMADRVAQRLQQQWGDDIAYLAASPLERAQETAAPLAAALRCPIVTDERLIEPANLFEGTAFAVGDGVLKRPSNWHKVRDPFTPSWGEPYLSIARRMLGAVYSAVQAVGDTGTPAGTPVEGSPPGSSTPADAGIRHAVLVSHQLPIWVLRRYLEGKRLWHNPAKRECALASVTSFAFAAGVLMGIAYDEPARDLVPAAAAGAMGA